VMQEVGQREPGRFVLFGTKTGGFASAGRPPGQLAVTAVPFWRAPGRAEPAKAGPKTDLTEK